MQKKEYTTIIAGKELKATFSDLTDQASGSVMLTYGNTVVLATAVMSKDKREGLDFFPLTVDYEEKFYAAGQILGSRYVRREGKPSDEAVLSGRVIDRTIRPLFDDYIRNDIQVVVTVLSLDKDDPDVLAINAASLALATSNIPFNGPVSAVRLGKHLVSTEFKVNPEYDFRGDGNVVLEMIACGKEGKISMIEAGTMEIGEDEIKKALAKASEEIEKMQEFQKKIVAEIGKEKTVIEREEISDEAKKVFESEIESLFEEYIFSGPGTKKINELKTKWLKLFKEKFAGENSSLAIAHFERKVDEIIHKEAIEKDRRADGRPLDGLRNLYAQAGGISPVLHGSGIFYRGGTHILSALTLGGPDDTQTIEGIETKKDKRFMHHYNFPPFSAGETGKMGGTNRREVGHGTLAEKALSAVIPTVDEFPYTIRLVSESMASNGSTSMASVCAASLALMDGGVPIKRPVAGIATGLMMESDTKYKILTDIQGPEDHYGDMDFKIAGTRNGVTAIQLDIKVGGIPVNILGEALDRARTTREKILDVMEKELGSPRSSISSFAPRIIKMNIKTDQIGMVIGTGGKTINKIKDESGVSAINIEDNGEVIIVGKNGSTEKAYTAIEALTHEYKAGEKYEGEVVKVLDFGAFVKISEGAEGLVHISQLAPWRIDVVTHYVKEGDKVPVVVKEVDERHRINLSIKDADPHFFDSKKEVLEKEHAPAPAVQ